MKILLGYYHSWEKVPDALIQNVMAEFHDNGAENLVFSHIWASRILREPSFFHLIQKAANEEHLSIVEMHAPYGPSFDLNCAVMARRPKMFEEHRTAMSYAAETGSKTYTVHIGDYDYVHFKTPINKVLRPLAIQTLEELLPTAEKLGLTICVENAFEPTNTPDEVAFFMEYFSSANLRCCFDVGHAHLMAPFQGKDPMRYSDDVLMAWGKKPAEYPDALGRLASYVATVHLHDNDSYSDAHALPGKGTIDWPSLIQSLEKCPNLVSLQTEVRTVPGLSIRNLCDVFRNMGICT